MGEWEKELDKKDFSESEYDSPSWSHKQAHHNGERAALKKVREILNFIG